MSYYRHQLPKNCKECGVGYRAERQTSEFCSSKCRMAFNQRRRERGVELYDVLMSSRFDMKTIAAPGDIVNRLLDAYRTADTAKRSGRASWQPWREAQTSIPMAYGKEGDKR